MKRSSGIGVLRAITFCVALFFHLPGYGQNATVNGADPRHETLNQRVVSVLFDTNIQSVPLPSTAGWTVTVNGIPVTIVSLAVAVNRVNITFDATPAHAAQNFIIPTDVLRVGYDRTAVGSNTLTSAAVEINNITIATTQSKNNFGNPSFPPASGLCGELVFNNLTDYGIVDACAPVLMNFRQFGYKLNLRVRNSSVMIGPYGFFYGVLWGDASSNNYTPVQTDATGAANPGFFDTTVPLCRQFL